MSSVSERLSDGTSGADSAPAEAMLDSVDFRRMVLSLPTPYMLLDNALRFVEANEPYLKATGRDRARLLGRYVFDVFPESPERLAVFRSAFERALAGETNSLLRQPFAIRQSGGRGDPKEIWWSCHHVPLHDAQGRICGLAQNAQDVTAEVMAERMRDAVASEFGHRMKNMLATVSSIARRSARSARSLDGFLEDFTARMEAMERTHQVLSSGGWKGMPLSELVASELSPFQEAQGRVRVAGPQVQLTGRQAQSLGMTLHELATNALKYGALSVPDGALDVSWSIDPAGRRLVISWREDGLENLAPPGQEGFGSTIVEKLMPMELSASVERRFLATGLHCTMAIPLR